MKDEDAFVVVKNRMQRIKTIKGWELRVLWKDGTTTWQQLADMKESNPVEVAEYVVAKEVNHEPFLLGGLIRHSRDMSVLHQPSTTTLSKGPTRLGLQECRRSIAVG